MTHDIRRVGVELLRHGPRHNQLLSPLTDYLAVCGDFPGGVVHVPYEHADAQNLLDDLRYAVASAAATDRLSVVRDRAGSDLASMLAAVPGLAGVLAGEHANAGSLTHLRLVLSAAELALLPFELAKVPVGAGSVGDDWLALQPDRPVCVTRHVRGVSATNGWPTTPKILFISGDDVPFEQHLDVFERVLAPWQRDPLVQRDDSLRHLSNELLTVIERASLDEVRAATAAQAFTHVHVLAHGAEIEERRTTRYGVALGDRVVTGSELALALTPPVGSDHSLPSVVTLAACDSAAQGTTVTPGGSVAHDLHASGIALVVASQFPISEAASIPFTETFYAGQLSGEHPLTSITNVRRLLANQFADEHAWASIVAYEALPDDFEACLERLHYWQARRAHEIALERLEQFATSDDRRMENLERFGTPFATDFASPSPPELARAFSAVESAAGRMPCVGPYAIECAGLQAAGSKRAAEVAFWLGKAPDVDLERRHDLFELCVGGLESALELYSDAVRALLSTTDGEPRRKVTIHWIVGQVLTMQALLGGVLDADLAGVARATTRFDLDHPDAIVRAWATVSSIESAILELVVGGPSEAIAGRALEAARDLVRAVSDDAEHIATTRRQMRRVMWWWGDEGFADLLGDSGIDRAGRWSEAHGVVPTASAIADILTPSSAARGASRRSAAQPSPTPGTTPSPPASPATAPDPTPTGTFEIEMVSAGHGDCLWLGYGGGDDADHHVLIDCGSGDAADEAAERVRSVGSVELFVLTHIDADHITGAIPLFDDAEIAARFDDVWFNGWEQLRGFLSVSQGEAFSALLDRDDRPFMWNRTARADDPPPPIVTDGLTAPEIELTGGLRLTVLSPTLSGLAKLARNWHAALAELDPPRARLARRSRPKPPEHPADLDLAALAADGATRDSSVPNLSSIALLAEFGGRSVLLTGDAHADVLATSIRRLQTRRGREGEPLRLDALKLSHHGSANATTRELLDAVSCRNYLVSTDGSRFYHPDREAIARVIVHGGPGPVLHFNHHTDLNGFWDDADLQARYGYTTRYPTEHAGLHVAL